MVVADTCIWIEWIAGTPLGRRFSSVLSDTSNVIVPTLVQMELYKWCLREMSEDAAEMVIAGTRLGHIVALTEPIALLAAELARKHKLASADAIIYATARTLDARLLTIDRHLEGLEDVEYLAKASVPKR